VKRLALLVLALAAFAPATANASIPCRDRIYNDWYADGKIATTYPLGCYRDALKHVPADAQTYSSLADDIRSAMQGARERLKGKSVPTQIGKGGTGAVQAASATISTKTHKAPHDPSAIAAASQTPPGGSTIAAAETSGSSGVPVPLLVLGAFALLLIAVGTAGAVAKRRRT